MAEALGDKGGVLVVDETGFLKKGTHSVGVARQYSGTAGRVENCQVGAFAAYASRWGQALVDRRLYLPRGWAEDDARRAKAQIPEETAFATKPSIAGAMLADLLDAGLPVRWVLADALHGSDFRLRHLLEERGQPVEGGNLVLTRRYHHAAGREQGMLGESLGRIEKERLRGPGQRPDWRRPVIHGKQRRRAARGVVARLLLSLQQNHGAARGDFGRPRTRDPRPDHRDLRLVRHAGDAIVSRPRVRWDTSGGLILQLHLSSTLLMAVGGCGLVASSPP